MQIILSPFADSCPRTLHYPTGIQRSLQVHSQGWQDKCQRPPLHLQRCSKEPTHPNNGRCNDATGNEGLLTLHHLLVHECMQLSFICVQLVYAYEGYTYGVCVEGVWRVCGGCVRLEMYITISSKQLYADLL